MAQTADPVALIGEARGRIGLTREHFATRLGVTLPTINRWENGRTKPSPLAIRTLRDLVASMGAEGKDLIDRFAQT